MFKVIMTETAAVTVQHNADIINDRRVQALIAQGGGSQGVAYGGQGNARTNTTTASGNATTQTPTQANPTPTQTTYRIGDTGPAGGLIFYDKGNNSGGWRYLEAAPVDTDKQFPFFPTTELPHVYEKWAGMQSRLVGDGKRNTELIFEFFVKNGGGFNTAVRYCMDLTVNGFDDWYLPAMDELNWLYGNLYLQNIGGLKNDWYWTSSMPERNYYDTASAKNFSTGNEETTRNISSAIQRRVNVRAIRQF
jgi:hypothetical protein